MREYELRVLLFELAREGCLRGPCRVRLADVASRLEISAWTLRRWLYEAVNKGYVRKVRQGRGAAYEITERGRRILKEMWSVLNGELRRRVLRLKGIVVRGLGEGAYYMSMEEYREAFKRVLGYYPYPGTLNVKLNGDCLSARKFLANSNGLYIRGFTKDGRRYSGVRCYRAQLRAQGREVECAVIVVEASKHGPDVLEVVAPRNLRQELGLRDGDEVEVLVSV